MQAKRRYVINVPHQQAYVQGKNGDRNGLMVKEVRAMRGLQPGNNFVRRIRPLDEPIGT